MQRDCCSNFFAVLCTKAVHSPFFSATQYGTKVDNAPIPSRAMFGGGKENNLLLQKKIFYYEHKALVIRNPDVKRNTQAAS